MYVHIFPLEELLNATEEETLCIATFQESKMIHLWRTNNFIP